MNQVRYFLALCEEKHFTRAAARCGVAQPSLTTAIRKLEQEFGAALFDRRRGEPTELGLQIRPFFQGITWNAENATARAQSLRDAAASAGAKLNGTPASVAPVAATDPNDVRPRQPAGREPITWMPVERDLRKGLPAME